MGKKGKMGVHSWSGERLPKGESPNNMKHILDKLSPPKVTHSVNYVSTGNYNSKYHNDIRGVNLMRSSPESIQQDTVAASLRDDGYDNANTSVMNVFRYMRRQTKAKPDGSISNDSDTSKLLESIIQREISCNSLRSLCLHSIGANILLYRDCDIKELFEYLPSVYLSRLCSIMCYLNTLTDETCSLFTCNDLLTLCVGNRITDKGFRTLCSTMNHTFDWGTTSVPAQWEDANPSLIQVKSCSNLSSLTSLYIIKSKLSLHSIELIHTKMQNIENLTFHNAIFMDDDVATDEHDQALKILMSLLQYNRSSNSLSNVDTVSPASSVGEPGGLRSLRKLHISHCDWLTMPALQLWLEEIRLRRKICQVLSSLRVVLVTSFPVPGGSSHDSCDRRRDLIYSFRALCGIELVFEE